MIFINTFSFPFNQLAADWVTDGHTFCVLPVRTRNDCKCGAATTWMSKISTLHNAREASRAFIRGKWRVIIIGSTISKYKNHRRLPTTHFIILIYQLFSIAFSSMHLMCNEKTIFIIIICIHILLTQQTTKRQLYFLNKLMNSKKLEGNWESVAEKSLLLQSGVWSLLIPVLLQLFTSVCSIGNQFSHPPTFKLRAGKHNSVEDIQSAVMIRILRLNCCQMKKTTRTLDWTTHNISALLSLARNNNKTIIISSLVN